MVSHFGPPLSSIRRRAQGSWHLRDLQGDLRRDGPGEVLRLAASPGAHNWSVAVNWPGFGGGKCSLSPYFLSHSSFPRAGQSANAAAYTHTPVSLCLSRIWSRLSLWAL